MANVLATASSNLPTPKRTPEFPVDREKMAKESGRPAGSGYQAELDNVKKLIKAVKAAYVRLTIDEGVQNPSAEQVFRANEADITFRLSNVHGDARLEEKKALALPLINSESNKLWAYIKEFTSNPAKYGAVGFDPIGKLKPIGRDSQLPAPAAPIRK
jgi:hypothetical protein